MKPYNIYLRRNHPSWLKNIFLQYNLNILKYLFRFFPARNKLDILEIGPGKGYFFHSLKKTNHKFSYQAVDSNKLILQNLDIKDVYKAHVPPLPKMRKKLDIIYAAYLIEHLKTGEDLYRLILDCKKYLKYNGILVFLAPNALNMKFEFYVQDYTHAYPVTKRAVSMALKDSRFEKVYIHDYADISLWLSSKPLLWWLTMYLSRIIFSLYNYHFFQYIFYSRKGKFQYDNLFYQLYSFTKVKNLMFIAQKS